MIFTIFSIVTLVLISFLSLYVLFANRKDLLNIYFSLLSLSAAFWIFSNFVVDNLKDEFWVMLWSKATLIGPIFIIYFFYKFSLFFPNKTNPNRTIEKILLACVVFFLVFLPTKWNISHVTITANNPAEITPGLLYVFFLTYFLVVADIAFMNVFRDYHSFTNPQKKQAQLFALGLGSSAVCGLIVDLILPLLGISQFVNIGPYFILFFIVFTAYAIVRHGLFNIKVIAAELLTFIIWVTLLIRLFMAENFTERLINGLMLGAMIIFGVLLIRSVLDEVNRREEMEKLAKDLAVANDKLKELDKAKSDFVTIASHQLRTPMTAIKGYTSMLIEGSYGKLPAKAVETLDKILYSSSRLISLVGEFLNVSRIERGKMEYMFTKADLKQMVQSLFEEFKIINDKRPEPFALSLKMEKDEDFTVNTDQDKIRQVFSNLIDNAMKYTEKGFIKVFLYKDHDTGVIKFKVQDSGMGINRETMLRLFEKFTRANQMSGSHTEGTGLGLFVAKEIIKAHRGRIWAESEGGGKGSIFHVELPGEKN